MEERLQKIISRAGIASRRAAEGLILAGRVTLDGQTVTELGVKVDPAAHEIAVDDVPIGAPERKVYFLFNKPRGCVSTAHDDRGRRTVLDYFRDVPERIYPVGRLDFDTQGLLLLTNDGTLMNGLLHPRYEVEKTYEADYDGDLTPEKQELLRRGIRLDDGMTAPAQLEILPTSSGRKRAALTIHEGRNRQVRRMFAAVGCDVRRLRRVRFAGLTLAGVKEGTWRALTSKEVAALYGLAGVKV